MFHTLAFRTTSFGTTADTKVNAVSDDQISIRNNNFFLPQTGRLLFAFAGAGDLVRSRLNCPTWRVISPVQLRQINSAILPASPPAIADYRQNPLTIPAEQELSMESTDGTGTTTAVGVAGVSFRYNAPPAGDIFTIRATSTTAAVAGSWTNISLTFDDDLPPGKYHLLGMNYIATNAIAARALLSGQNWRPGCVGAAAADQVVHPMFMKGRLGSWGMFDNTVMPQVEVFNNSTDAVHTVFFDVLRMGG